MAAQRKIHQPDGKKTVSTHQSDLLLHSDRFSVEPIGRIKMDLTNVIRDERKRVKKESGKAAPPKFDIDIKIELTVGSDKGILEVKGKVGLKTIGSTQIEWVADPDAPKR